MRKKASTRCSNKKDRPTDPEIGDSETVIFVDLIFQDPATVSVLGWRFGSVFRLNCHCKTLPAIEPFCKKDSSIFETDIIPMKNQNQERNDFYGKSQSKPRGDHPAAV